MQSIHQEILIFLMPISQNTNYSLGTTNNYCKMQIIMQELQNNIISNHQAGCRHVWIVFCFCVLHFSKKNVFCISH